MGGKDEGFPWSRLLALGGCGIAAAPSSKPSNQDAPSEFFWQLCDICYSSQCQLLSLFKQNRNVALNYFLYSHCFLLHLEQKSCSCKEMLCLDLGSKHVKTVLPQSSVTFVFIPVWVVRVGDWSIHPHCRGRILRSPLASVFGSAQF